MKAYSYKSYWKLLTLAVFVGIVLLGCKENNPTTEPSLTLRSTSLGNVLTGEGGKTLYFFAPDVAGDATCSGTCIANWPVFYQETLTLGDGLKSSDFASITRTDGTKQTTFKGWPLYYFKNDVNAGDVLGEGIGNGAWMVAKPHYEIMLATRQLVGNDGKNYTFDTKEGVGNSTFLVDSLGRTLYAFANDKKNVNKFTKTDLSNNATWPIFEVPTNVGDIPSTLTKSDFATITSAGKIQLTYKGWPLYYFGTDEAKRGNTRGVSVPRPGVWSVVNKTSTEATN